MKKTILTLLSVLFCAITFAQNVPQGINYQAIARDAAGAELANDTLIVQFSVLEGAAISWQEIDTVTTNEFGLFTTIIGGGTSTSIGSSLTFDLVDWGAAAHSLKVEIDYGNGYLDMGTTDFMSVPYSLHAKTAANGSTIDELQSLRLSGDTLFIEIQGSVNSGNWIILPSSAPTLLGCTDSTATNYNPLANTDDGSCIAVVNGCTDSTAYSGYNPLANTDDGSCVAVVNGCTDSLYTEYDPLANTDDGSCATLIVNGCTDVMITVGGGSYDSEIGWSLVDGSGVTVASGGAGLVGPTCLADDCYIMNMTDSYGDGWNGATYSITDNNSGTVYGTGGLIGSTSSGSDNISIGVVCPVYGCTDSTAFNYNALANTDDGSCWSGCTDSTAFNYNPLANTDDGSCSFTLSIGHTYQGGIVFWIDPNDSTQGLIAAPTDHSTNAKWGCYGTLISGADGTAIGTGNQNTIDIEVGCTTSGIAADICANLTLNGYSDWFLPSKDELNQMWLNIGQGNSLGLGNIGGFANSSYWSSTEFNSERAWWQYFHQTGSPAGSQSGTYKSFTSKVRAVRAFINGCTDPLYTEYNPLANTDDGTCATLIVNGCTNNLATNYDPLANTDDGSCTYTLAIGDTLQGGIIFWLDASGGHGLIAAPSDQSTGAQWGCLTYVMGTSDGDGAQNTINIEAGCTTPGIAADICANLTLGGYSDWFLPSKHELNAMQLNIGQGNALGLGNIGGFASSYYWSSSEVSYSQWPSSNYAWMQHFNSGVQYWNYLKDYFYSVRAVRAF